MEKITQSFQNTESKFHHIVEQGEQPLHKRTGFEKNSIATETFRFFTEFLQSKNFTEYTDSSESYKMLPHKKIIARREDPRKLFDLFTKDSGYNIDFTEDRYANCVEWNPHTDGNKNIYNAFMEGFTNLNGVVCVVGFSPDKENDLIKMPDSVANFHGLDRQGVRSYKGVVTSETIHFVTLRIPGHLLPESELTEDEIDRVDVYRDKINNGESTEPIMIFRTFLPNYSSRQIQ